jgi:nucleotide-binding universal stress UspA family protein
MHSFKKILVPVDFDGASDAAIRFAVELAQRDGAELALLHVWELPAYAYPVIETASADVFTPIRAAAMVHLDELVARTQKDHVRTSGVLRDGLPWRAIIDEIEATAPDLVVVGTHGRRGVARMFLGSVAEKLVRLSAVPVLTVHGADSVAA